MEKSFTCKFRKRRFYNHKKTVKQFLLYKKISVLVTCHFSEGMDKRVVSAINDKLLQRLLHCQALK